MEEVNIFNFVSRFIHKFIGLSPATINSSLCVHMYLMIINVSRSVLKPTQVLEQSQIYAWIIYVLGHNN
jgi:hypothetical protein